jgi:hypothetical protein
MQLRVLAQNVFYGVTGGKKVQDHVDGSSHPAEARLAAADTRAGDDSLLVHSQSLTLALAAGYSHGNLDILGGCVVPRSEFEGYGKTFTRREACKPLFSWRAESSETPS